MVWMHMPQTKNGIYLPVSGRCRPDVGVLMADYAGLPAGTVVAVAPYRGAWFDHEGGEYRLFGVSERADEAIVLYADGDEWKPAPGWMLAKPEKREVMFAEIKCPGLADVEGQRACYDTSALSYEVPMLGMVATQSQVLAEVH